MAHSKHNEFDPSWEPGYGNDVGRIKSKKGRFFKLALEFLKQDANKVLPKGIVYELGYEISKYPWPYKINYVAFWHFSPKTRQKVIKYKRPQIQEKKDYARRYILGRYASE